jgi:uncharacterized membrane protein YdjX (TVP38/TMEM64 family)
MMFRFAPSTQLMNSSSAQQSSAADQPPPATDQPTTIPSWFRLVIPGVLLGCAAAWLWLTANTSRLETWLGSAGPWAPIAFVSISVVLMSVLLPKTAVSVTAGALFGTTLGSSLMMVIGVAAAALDYAIGHWWLGDMIRRRLRRPSRRDNPDQPTWSHAVVELTAEAGFGLHLLIRLSPVPTMVISYVMGAVGARWLPYLAAAAVAIIPQVLWVHGGATATMIHNPQASALRFVSGGLSIVVAIAVTVIVPREAIRRLRSQASSSRVRNEIE